MVDSFLKLGIAKLRAARPEESSAPPKKASKISPYRVSGSPLALVALADESAMVPRGIGKFDGWRYPSFGGVRKPLREIC